MKIEKEKLKTALEIVKPGLANKDIIEQTTSFAFIKERVVTYNDEISISHPIEGLKIKGAVQAEELYKFLSKVKTKEIEIKKEGNEIILKSGRATTGYLLKDEIILPLSEEISKKGKWQDIPENFLEFLKFASMSCSKNMTDPKLTCVHVNEKGIIESCDNLRIVHCKLKKQLNVPTFLIPATSINVIFKNKPIKIAQGKGWVHFKTKVGTIISCRTFKEKYVNTSKYLKPIKKGIPIRLPKTLNEVLDKAIIFAKRKQSIDESIDVEINNKQIKVKSILIDEVGNILARFEESIPIKYKGKTILFTVTPYLLKDILFQTNECVLHKDSLTFKGKDWIYMTTLTPIKQDEDDLPF